MGKSSSMVKKFLKEYCSFTKKERTAVIVLIVLITIICILPDLIPDNDPVIDEAALQSFNHQLAKLQVVHADTADYHFNEKDAYSGNKPFVESSGTGALFYFDPNNLPFDGWQKLGIREKTIKTIQNYLSKGGRFRHKEDLKKIYGMRGNDVQRLLPYIRITPEAHGFTSGEKAYTSTMKLPHNKWLSGVSGSTASVMLDINTADTSGLIALPGIGPKLASRIIYFREKLGGFYSLDQLSEVYGLADSIIQRIRPILKISAENVGTLHINTASANELRQHPYFRQNIGDAIIAYRLQHGAFAYKEDLLKIDIITPEVFKKLYPYVSLD